MLSSTVATGTMDNRLQVLHFTEKWQNWERISRLHPLLYCSTLVQLYTRSSKYYGSPGITMLVGSTLNAVSYYITHKKNVIYVYLLNTDLEIIK